MASDEFFAMCRVPEKTNKLFHVHSNVSYLLWFMLILQLAVRTILSLYWLFRSDEYYLLLKTGLGILDF